MNLISALEPNESAISFAPNENYSTQKVKKRHRSSPSDKKKEKVAT